MGECSIIAGKCGTGNSLPPDFRAGEKLPDRRFFSDSLIIDLQYDRISVVNNHPDRLSVPVKGVVRPRGIIVLLPITRTTTGNQFYGVNFKSQPGEEEVTGSGEWDWRESHGHYVSITWLSEK